MGMKVGNGCCDTMTWENGLGELGAAFVIYTQSLSYLPWNAVGRFFIPILARRHHPVLPRAGDCCEDHSSGRRWQ